MSKLQAYFDTVTYKSVYTIGDRVRGVTSTGIPFVGTVGNDKRVNLEQPAQVTVHLDLPMQDGDTVRTLLFCTHEQLKPLKQSRE